MRNSDSASKAILIMMSVSPKIAIGLKKQLPIESAQFENINSKAIGR